MQSTSNDLRLFIEQNTTINVDAEIFMQMWNILTGDEWQFLSPDIITNDMGFARAGDFYRDNLIPFYKDNVDFKQSTVDNSSIRDWEKTRLVRRGTSPKYYLVTKKTMVILLCKSKRAKSERYLEHFYEMQRLIVEYYKSREVDPIASLTQLMSSAHIADHTATQTLKYQIVEEKSQIGYIYFIYAEENPERFKIGYSDNVEVRMRALQCGNSSELKYYRTMPSNQMSEDEAYLHKRYAASNIRGEWFAMTFADVDDAIEHMEDRRNHLSSDKKAL